jgi:hypothetical protein
MEDMIGYQNFHLQDDDNCRRGPADRQHHAGACRLTSGRMRSLNKPRP